MNGLNGPKNRSHSTIDNLPENVRKHIEDMLLTGSKYMEVADYLKEKGYGASYSAVWRYGSGYLKKFESVRMSREYAKLLAEDNVDRPTTELHEANNAIISQILMETLMDEDTSTEDKIKTAQAISTLQTSQVRNEKLKIDARKAAGVVHTAMNLLKEKVFAIIGKEHPEIAEAIIKIAEEVENENEIVL